MPLLVPKHAVGFPYSILRGCFCRRLPLLLAAVLLSTSATSAEEFTDHFESPALSKSWTPSRILTQGPGAQPKFQVSGGHLLWNYRKGNSHAQQQVLLRDRPLPLAGESVQVTLLPSIHEAEQTDFAGLALSRRGVQHRDRTGLLLFFYEPASRRLQLWQFRQGTEKPSQKISVSLKPQESESLVLRLTRLRQDLYRASWSQGSGRFHTMAVTAFGPLKAVGMYTGNARIPSGNRIAFDDFEISTAQGTEQLPEDDSPSTPDWTSPEAFMKTASPAAFPLPEITSRSRPGAYWWWPGSAVSKEDLTWNLKTYREAGWGNMGVIGIYGVQGEEDRAIPIFTKRWFEMFNHALAVADRLEMNLDLTPSSGWRLGGPHITEAHGEMAFDVKDGRIVARPLAAQVKRAGPGGKGRALNPYSISAVEYHFDWLEKRFEEGDGRFPRAFYYDSFENPGNWCPEFLPTFEKLRGYRLEDHAEALAGEAEKEYSRRVLCDYRETLSDLLLDCVEWIVHWADERGSGLRMQAHGAPANILDMYALAEIPETEVFGASKFAIPGFRRDPKWIRDDRQSDLVNRFASSAAHVAGRKLVISESFTWLRNHFHTSLSQIKAESDQLWLNGINDIYYHGICFTPEESTWPGWLFYASTQANARNSIFRDLPALNTYMTRCQSLLQEGKPHNDVLLYWPIYDLWMEPGKKEKRFSVHHPEWIEGTPCGRAGQWMQEHGYTFDFISDHRLQQVECNDHSKLFSGGNEYRTILIPEAENMKVETFEHLLELAEEGATILVWKHLPRSVPGWHEHETKTQRLKTLVGDLRFDAGGSAALGDGIVLRGDELGTLLSKAGIPRESSVDHKLQFIRRKNADSVTYFLVNHSSETIAENISPATKGESAAVFDPMTGRSGVVRRLPSSSRLEIPLKLRPGETRFVRVFHSDSSGGPIWKRFRDIQPSIPLTGTWQVDFLEGGPTIPESYQTEKPASWTHAPDEEAKRFAGAACYSMTLNLPSLEADRWVLDLGDVRESARVRVNGEPAGIAFAHPYRVEVTDSLRPGDNEICIEVTNLSANRIRDLDRRNIYWKKFHDINLVDHQYRTFDAGDWELEPSGLLGPVTLIPQKQMEAE